MTERQFYLKLARDLDALTGLIRAERMQLRGLKVQTSSEHVQQRDDDVK
jgi:hypothetical protein